MIANITGKRNTDGEIPGVQSEESFLKPGEHIAEHWVKETNTFVWYLGIVEQVNRHIASIIYLKRSDKLAVNWIIPDDPEKLDIGHDQVLTRDLPVIYHGVSCHLELRDKQSSCKRNNWHNGTNSQGLYLKSCGFSINSILI